MTAAIAAPCLEKSVTKVTDVPDVKWVQTTTPGLETWLFEAFRSIQALQEMPEGWDGHHSAQISTAAAGRTRQLLSRIRAINLPQPSIFPFAGGGLGVQWQAGNRELQLTVYPDGVITYLCAISDDEECVYDGDIAESNLYNINRLLAWLIEG